MDGWMDGWIGWMDWMDGKQRNYLCTEAVTDMLTRCASGITQRTPNRLSQAVSRRRRKKPSKFFFFVFVFDVTSVNGMEISVCSVARLAGDSP